MNKKNNLVFLVLCAFTLFAFEAKATLQVSQNTVLDSPTGSGENIIELQGKLDTNTGPNDILAWLENNTIHVSFNRNFGYVSITLYNPNGNQIYDTVVNTGVQSLVLIPFLGSISGTYTLVLESANGFAEGDFEQE